MTTESFNNAVKIAKELNDGIEVNLWKGERIYVNRPYESKAYQRVGWVRVSDGKIFPDCGEKPRTERDRDAIKILNAISEAI